MGKTDALFIHRIEGKKAALKQFQTDMGNQSPVIRNVIFKYPTVYIHVCRVGDEYEVYVGETANIIRRTGEHFYTAEHEEESWQGRFRTGEPELFIIGHGHFNKSLTMDIENLLMHYLSGIEKVRKIHNSRENAQNQYYTCEELDDIFLHIWAGLKEKNPDLFINEDVVKDSALFKASPLNKLREEQDNAQELILNKLRTALQSDEKEQLIFIAGEAGTGKTVLISSIFYEICMNREKLGKENLQCRLLVNHKEQLGVYEQIADKLNLNQEKGAAVCNPTHFINKHSRENPVDVVMVDEAHLLWTQSTQAYNGKNQLADIRDRSRVVIILFDEKQILTREQYVEASIMDRLVEKAKSEHSYIELKDQLRIRGDRNTIKWIHDFINEQKIHKIPQDSKGYEIKIFDTPGQLQKEIQELAGNPKTALSRIIATFDWEYDPNPKKGGGTSKPSEVRIGDWSMPWNYKTEPEPTGRKSCKKQSWAEQKHTINEVGSIFTIQGFDLNYAGVILGPSVKYRDGNIIFDPSCSKHKKAVQSRTLSDGTKANFATILIRNSVNVLMTRGVDGLYIYAQDDELREALKQAENGNAD